MADNYNFRKRKFPDDNNADLAQRPSKIAKLGQLDLDILDTLYHITEIIQTETVKQRFQEFEQSKDKLQFLNQKLLGRNSLKMSKCQSTEFLETLLRFETAKFRSNEAEMYRTNVLEIWEMYMRVHMLPYLAGPIAIVQKGQLDNDEQELASIMTFAKFQWDVLYNGCPYPKNPDSGEHYNMIGFMLGKNDCHCTCITALLLTTAECLGLFPKYIHGQVSYEHIYVITHTGLILEGAGSPASTLSRGDEPRNPTKYAIKSPKEFLDNVGWYEIRQNVRKSKTKDLVESMNIHEPNNDDFKKALAEHLLNPLISDDDFVEKWIQNFEMYKYNSDDSLISNPKFMNMYYKYLLILYKFRDSNYLGYDKTLTIFKSPIPQVLYIDEYNIKRKYEMLLFVTFQIVIVSDSHGYEISNPQIFYLLDNAPTFTKNIGIICNTFTSENTRNVEEFKMVSKENLQKIIDALKSLRDPESQKHSHPNYKHLNLYIRSLQQYIKSCF